MKTGLTDILRCPVCHSFNFQVVSFSDDGTIASGSEEDCEIIKLDTGEIYNGIIFCVICRHWFPIIKNIPVLLNDELRDKGKDREFLEKYERIIPKKFLDAYLTKNK